MKKIATPFSGVITLTTWTLFQNGGRYMYAWCPRWEVATDKVLGGALGDASFRSSEKWSLVGRGRDGEISTVIPGCQIKAFVVCENPPAQMADALCYNLETKTTAN